MSRWATQPLGEVADVIRGVSFDKSEVTDTAASGYVPILRAGNIGETLQTHDDLVWVPEYKVGAAQKLKLYDVAICMSSGSADVVGKIAQLHTEWHGSVGAFCAIIRFHKIDPRFGAFWLRSPGFMAWRDSQAKGANIQNLRKAELERLELPIPPPDEQERIVRILDEAEALRRLRAQTDERTEAVIPSLFDELFGDPSVNALQWPVRTLEEVASETQLGLVRGASEMAPDKMFPYLRMDSIVGDGRLNLEGLKRVDASEKEACDYSLSHGDFLFNTRNSHELVGKTGLYEGGGQVLFNNNIMRIRFRAGVDPYYMTWLFQTPYIQNELERRKSGTTSVVAVYWKSLKTVPVMIPPLERQRTFAARVAEIRVLEAAQAASRKRLDDLFQSLLHCAFRGEL